MRCIKMLGLAIAAAAILTAIVGTGAASATVLCKNEACTETYGVGTVILAEQVGKSVFKAGAETIDECSSSEIEAKVEQIGSPTSTNRNTFVRLPFSLCNVVTAVLKLGTFEVHNITGTKNGTVTSLAPELTILVKNVLTCTFSTGLGIDLGVLTKGLIPILHINAKFQKNGGGFGCPGEVTWTAEYEIKKPTPIYVG